ncbi:MAG: pyridoxal phosphate-dependent aminotransferase [Candidatus Pristimantibacillus lignocellulolyticus]|uniref:cysteine-S-conjugate beta-lyase n=1 Tax=Candidatus Pristimantibacillus lignocellulolyticus TaxID=2994561 RepID=A0A9J6ZF54_9BACL|nr:MAG: pyridoxal phosphate-dependent aminotransferase [Candidatus Pristimantibacillus lignocellulolyticus]
MKTSFDKLISRFGTNSAKWDGCALSNGSDVISLSVADMDLQAPQQIIDKAMEFASHGVYGYTELYEKYYLVVQMWLQRRYQWEVLTDWIVFCPRIVQAVSLIIQDFSEPGDAVLMHTPAYQPIANAVALNDRKFVASPLLLNNGRYEIDFDDMERHMKSGVKLLILCSPHNPTGRVWTITELEKMASLCVQYDVLIVSDDIHADFIRPNHEHTIIARLSEQIAERSIICTSPGKTFNLASIEIANIIIPNLQLRKKFQNSLLKAGIHNPTFFAVPLLEVAYEECDVWLQQLQIYLESNLQFVSAFIKDHFSKLKVIEPDGTYLLWIDCRNLFHDEQQIKEWIVTNSRVSVSFGSSFGSQGNGFIRINLAAPKVILEEALHRMLATYSSIN